MYARTKTIGFSSVFPGSFIQMHQQAVVHAPVGGAEIQQKLRRREGTLSALRRPRGDF